MGDLVTIRTYEGECSLYGTDSKYIISCYTVSCELAHAAVTVDQGASKPGAHIEL